MTSEIHIGTLYTHRLHGQVFLVGSVDYDMGLVCVLNTMEAKEFYVPMNAFLSWFKPMGGTHE